MTSERQVAANRRNARHSTGPRSDAGRKRSSRNSLRHGLAAAGTLNTKRIADVERLAHEIAGGTTDVVTVDCARTIAQANIDLAQIGRVKVALLSRVMAFGEVKRPATPQLIAEAKRFFAALDRGELIRPRLEAPAMPAAEPERTAEALRRALPELIRFDRYERRAAGRRARAVHLLLERKRFEQPAIVQETKKCKTKPIFS